MFKKNIFFNKNNFLCLVIHQIVQKKKRFVKVFNWKKIIIVFFVFFSLKNFFSFFFVNKPYYSVIIH